MLNEKTLFFFYVIHYLILGGEMWLVIFLFQAFSEHLGVLNDMLVVSRSLLWVPLGDLRTPLTVVRIDPAFIFELWTSI